MSMTVSVLTLVRNRRSNLENLMIGLRRSSVLPEELVIVHMNEDPYTELPPLPFPVNQVRLTTEGADKIPLAKARNLAANTARGQLLLFLDVDCIPHPDLVREMLERQQQRPGLLMGEIRYLPEHALQRGWTLDDLERTGVPHPARPRVELGDLLPMDNYTLFWSLCFSMPRNVFLNIGGFDEDYRGYGAEDTDFAFRAERAGVPFAIVGAKGYHQYHHVYRPPLNNFDSIVNNANVFRRKWNRWAMESWLEQFTERGYIDWREERTIPIEVQRVPSAREIEATRQFAGKGW